MPLFRFRCELGWVEWSRFLFCSGEAASNRAESKCSVETGEVRLLHCPGPIRCVSPMFCYLSSNESIAFNKEDPSESNHIVFSMIRFASSQRNLQSPVPA